jgi:hypothetical protein
MWPFAANRTKPFHFYQHGRGQKLRAAAGEMAAGFI